MSAYPPSERVVGDEAESINQLTTNPETTTLENIRARTIASVAMFQREKRSIDGWTKESMLLCAEIDRLEKLVDALRAGIRIDVQAALDAADAHRERKKL